jgi:ATP-binding cassette, subfamily B (MDR/TAP), member 1
VYDTYLTLWCLSEGVGRKLAESVQFAVTFVGSLIYSFYASWQVSLLVLTVAPLMSITAWFLVKMNTSQTSRSNATYSKAGSIVTTAVSSIRTVLSLNAVDQLTTNFKTATTEAYTGAVSQLWLLGLANGLQMASFILTYVVVTLYGSYILYDNVKETGCDPSGAVVDNERCDPSGVDVFGSLMGVTFAASVLPQISVAIESFIGKS